MGEHLIIGRDNSNGELILLSIEGISGNTFLHSSTLVTY
jgi:hypothetical protein